jgi:hypothetical protein
MSLRDWDALCKAKLVAVDTETSLPDYFLTTALVLRV